MSDPFRDKWEDDFEAWWERAGPEHAPAKNLARSAWCACQALAEIDERNIGADLTAQALRTIAETGIHRGVFGGPEIEAAAQAILAVRVERDRLLDSVALMERHAASVLAERDRYLAALELKGGAP